jgi:hypothetical protein
MSPGWKRLLSKHKSKALVEFCRRPKIQEQIAGFVVGFSESLLLLHRLDWNTFTLDGYTILRNKDVKRYRAFTRSSYWPAKAIEKFKLQPKSPPTIPLSNWPEAISGISKFFPIMHVECEIAFPDECQIGVPLELTKKLLLLDPLSFSSEWTGPWSIKLDQITRIDFGGGYERALTATAPKRSPKILRQYGLSLFERPNKSLVSSLRAMRGLELQRIEQPKSS